MPCNDLSIATATEMRTINERGLSRSISFSRRTALGATDPFLSVPTGVRSLNRLRTPGTGDGHCSSCPKETLGKTGETVRVGWKAVTAPIVPKQTGHSALRQRLRPARRQN
jgi:hypothetical protein